MLDLTSAHTRLRRLALNHVLRPGRFRARAEIGGEYGHAARYDELLSPGSTELSPLLAALPEPCADLLDLGGGTGRLSLALAERGSRVTLIDRSPAMLAQARRSVAQAAPAVRQRVCVVEQDLRALALTGTYDGAIALFDVLAEQTSLEQARQVVANIGRRLRPRGWLVVDLPHIVYWRGVAGWGRGAWRVCGTRQVGQARYYVWMAARQSAHDTHLFEVQHAASRDFVRYQYWSTWFLFVPPDAWRRVFEATGFEVERCWGDWSGGAVGAGSARLIYWLRRGASTGR
jgi:SAM-dependent methyltransferase